MILIVDDKPENLLSLKKVLELQDFYVDTADSGEEALKKILRNSYSLIILDVQMPGMDGFEVAETLAGFSKAKDIPIIFLSAVNTDKKFITKGYTSGGVDYVTKPVDPDIFILKVKTLHRLYEQNRQLNEMHRLLEQKVADRTHELTIKNAELEASNHELQQFASVASHDLKEPLRKIQLFSSILQNRFKDIEGAEETLGRIIDSSHRMSVLINDLLSYSRLSVDSLFQHFSLKDVAEDIIQDLDIVIREKDATIELGKLPEIEMIPGQLRQVFQNLISNSLKFSRADIKPVIRIWAEVVNEKDINASSAIDGDYVRIFVSDNGIGFNEKYLEKIFTIFQRLHSKEAFEGTGIGLAIARKIIDKHNGLITARSKEGEGATFIIVLPQQQTLAPQTI